MKVKDLIAQLESHDPESDVYCQFTYLVPDEDWALEPRLRKHIEDGETFYCDERDFFCRGKRYENATLMHCESGAITSVSQGRINGFSWKVPWGGGPKTTFLSGVLIKFGVVYTE